MRLSVVIPIYKNSTGLRELNEKLVARESEFSKLGFDFETIFVVDGSPDDSFTVLSELKGSGLTPANTLIIKLSRNFGQVPALLAGLELAEGDCTICYSADMQDPSELFMPMFEYFKKGNEIVIATRESRSDGFLWDLTSKVGYYLLRSEVPSIPKGGFDFFLVGRKSKNLLLQRNGSKRFLQGDLINLGFSPIEIKYNRVKRKYGKSSYSLRKRVSIFSDAFYDSSDMPIKVATKFGFGIAGLGFVSTMYVLFGFFSGKQPFNGFAALACGILILGGMQLAIIGIIGEYIYRTYDIARNRPHFAVEKVV